MRVFSIAMKVVKCFKYIQSLGTGLLDLLYPLTCAACIRREPVDGGIFCVDCLASLSFTETHLFKDNQFEQHFWGRIDIQRGMSMLYLIPGGITQKILYQIKYRDRKEFAEEIGRWYGQKVLESKKIEPFDLIIPVPLHWKKEKMRGYNQSTYFAKGLSQAFGVPFDSKNLKRIKITETQTYKSRIERMDNMTHAFKIENLEIFHNKHILLVDDVLTTGATLEACALQLLKCENVRVSMMTIAMGRL
jgi:ComF family protein